MSLMVSPASIRRRWRCAPLCSGKRGIDAQLGAHGRASTRAGGPPRRGRVQRRRVEVDQRARPAVADRAPDVLLDQPRRAGRRRARPRRCRARPGPRRRRSAPASASDSAAVPCASQMRTSTVPKVRCGRTDHQTCVYSTIESVRDQERRGSRGRRPSSPKASGTPQRGKLLVKICVRAECRPESIAVDERRVGRDRQQRRQHRAQPVADAHRAVGAAHADVDVQRERVVAPRDVLQAVLHAPVVLGVDDALLAVVGPRVGAGRRRARSPCAAASANRRPRASRWRAPRVVRSPRRARSGSRSPRRSARRRSRPRAPGRPARRRAAPRSAARGPASRGRASRTPPRGRR